MVIYPVNTVVAADGSGDIVFTAAIDSGNKADCCFSLKDKRGPVDLIVYSVSGNITVTIQKGDGPTAAENRTVVVPSGFGKCIPIPTGEFACTDDSIYFRVEGEQPLNVIQPMISVIQHVNTMTY